MCSCEQHDESMKVTDDLNALKNEFIEKVFEKDLEEGPFHFSYDFRTVFLSKEIVSLYGELNEYIQLPHSWGRYEGKTFCKVGSKFKEVTLEDLFRTKEEKEFLRKYCESYAKQNSFDYFVGDDPLHTTLDADLISTFVVDEKGLRIIFQPYAVGSYLEGPFVVLIPYADLEGNWDRGKLLTPLIDKVAASNDFVSTWNLENYYSQM
jgi:hypothetical protein